MKRKKYLWYGIVVLWTVVIFSFSLQPADESSALSLGFIRNVLEVLAPDLWTKLNSVYVRHLDLIHTLVRKGAHFTEYMILGILASAAAGKAEISRPRGKATCYCVAVAMIDETIQRFVEGRYGCLRDVCIDSAGALMGVLIVFLWCRRKENRAADV